MTRTRYRPTAQSHHPPGLRLSPAQINLANIKPLLGSRMRDPLAPPPTIAVQLVQPFAQRYGFLTLPLHAHEIAGSCLIYTSLFLLVSPSLTTRLLYDRYSSLPRKSQLEWHVRVVSTIQSAFMSILALYVIFVNHERRNLSHEGRLWGYDGATGMVQAFAAGYFLWDVFISVYYVGILGVGSLVHAVSALLITCIGFVSHFRCSLSVLLWTI